MKFFGSFIVLALINIASVFAGPPPNVYKKDSTFEYWLSSGNAYIMDVVNTGVSNVIIPPYVTFDGIRYPVTQILGCSTNKKFQSITVNDNFDHDFSFGSFALQYTTSIKNIIIKSKRVKASDNAFYGLGNYLNISGAGVDNMMLSYAKSWLFYQNIDPIRGYVSDANKKSKLIEIARAVNKEFSYYSNISNSDNGAVALALKKGSSLGISRAFRIIALAAGFNYNDVHVISDNKYYSWNTINLSGRWYNLDVIKVVNTFYGDSAFNNKVLKPLYGSLTNTSNWIIYIGQYGYSGERPTGTENFTSWLVRNRQGVRVD